VAFIDAHRARFGVEPICRVLTEHGAKIAPSTFYAARSRPPSARAVCDAEVQPIIARVRAENYVAYGADKMWDHLNNVEGVRVARCTVERLMAQMGLS
jgi:putative transposase